MATLLRICDRMIRRRDKGQGSSTGYTYMSGEETVESTSVATVRTNSNHHHQLTLGQHQDGPATANAKVPMHNNYSLNYDPSSSMATPSYSNWAVLPSYP